MSEKYPMVYATVGIHPHDAKDYDAHKHDALLREWASKEKVVAIGEIGLDYHYDYSPGIQQEVFIRQLIIAKAVALPIVIHNRESMEDMVRILKELFCVRVRWHHAQLQRLGGNGQGLSGYGLSSVDFRTADLQQCPETAGSRCDDAIGPVAD